MRLSDGSATGVSNEEPSVEASREAIRLWEELIGVWENDDGEIVGAVTTEYPKRGDVFFQRCPGYKDLPGQMLDHAEENLTDEEAALRIHIGDRDEPLRALVLERGYAWARARPSTRLLASGSSTWGTRGRGGSSGHLADGPGPRSTSVAPGYRGDAPGHREEGGGYEDSRGLPLSGLSPGLLISPSP